MTMLIDATDIRAVVNKRKEALAESNTANESVATGMLNSWTERKYDYLFIGQRVGSIQAPDLLTLIRQPRGVHLTVIEFSKLKIEGDFSLVTQAMSNLRHLTSITLWLNEHSHDETHAMLKALGQNPELVQFTLNCRDSQNVSIWEENTLVDLVRQAKKLNMIWIQSAGAHRGLGESEISTEGEFIAACLDLKNLARLYLLPRRSSPTLHPELASVCKTVPLQLKTLVLRVMAGWNLSVFANSLTELHSLEKFNIKRANLMLPRIVEEEVEAFCSALEKSTTLKVLSMDWHMDLQVSLSEGCREKHKRLQFLLLINSRGRVPSSVNDWMKRVTDEDDISVIYFYLRRNPLLCFPDNTKADGWQTLVKQVSGIKRKASNYWNSRRYLSTKKLGVAVSSSFIAGAAVGAVLSGSRNCSA